MRAVRVHVLGGPEVLRVDDVPVPAPGRGEVVVRVRAAGVNMLDTLQRSGRAPLPDLPTGVGLEGAGEVVEVGDGVRTLREGQRVVWAHAQGSYAEHARVPAAEAVAIPDDLDEETAAAVMHQGITAHYLVTSLHAVGADDTVLVFGAGGGVGRLLVQLATRRGARVLAATSTQHKAEQIRALGAADVLLYEKGDLAAAVRERTDGRGVDVVYDPLGAATFETALAALRPRGLYVLFGATTGPVPPIDLARLAAGSLFVTRPALAAYTRTQEEFTWRATAVLELARTRDLDVHVHGRYELEAAASAHEQLVSGTTTGKLLLLP